MENKTWNGRYTVGPLSTGFLLEGLQTHTRYGLQVAALTDKGPGPYSETVKIGERRVYVFLELSHMKIQLKPCTFHLNTKTHYIIYALVLLKFVERV